MEPLLHLLDNVLDTTMMVIALLILAV